MERDSPQGSEFTREADGSPRRLDTLVLDQTERLVLYRLERAQEYTRLGLKQLRAALEVSGPEQLAGLLDEQVRGMTMLTEDLTHEIKSLASMGEELRAEFERCVRESPASQLGLPLEAESPEEQARDPDGASEPGGQDAA